MPQIADRKSMARYICVDKGATHPALQREELPKHMAIYADYGVTGTDLRQRPELNRLLTDCRAGRVNCIVAQSTTHLARRTADLLTILQELQSLGITTDFEKERFSTNSPTGKKMSNARIIEIPATRQIRSGKNNTMRKMRVAAYCRVSTEEEEQQGSFETQKLYYTEKINSTSEWELAGIYADDGISGIHTKKRDGFNQMIQDCKKKKIDLILTKSISRFARNTLDSI
ncbi:recombinase family protein, partial [Gemmiger formicilis]